MGRKRKSNKDLPERWTRKHGAIYYIVPDGLEARWDNKKWFRLGGNEAEAYREWAKRVEASESITTMAQLFHRYLLEHTPTVRPKTQRHHRDAIANLMPVFGEFRVVDFESSWAFKYYDKRSQYSISVANSEIKVLSHAFTKAIEWGVMKNSEHPIRGLKIKKSDPVRDRYVEDWELIEFLSVCPQWLRLYVQLKLMTGMDKSTLLSIRLTDLNSEGIVAARVKTKGKARVYAWSEELQSCIDAIKRLHRRVGSMWLFCSKQGQPLRKDNGSTSAFDSAWKRAMAKALDETKLAERFTEHDLRAKAASDAESLEFAQKLLDHSDSKITKKVYRRKVETVETGRVNPKILDSE